MIGNDIVDLQYFESPPYQHVRYVERVCTSSEADAVRASSNPAGSFAAVWAAKEAAFKLLSRVYSLRHFVPREFVTDFAPHNSRPSGLCVSHHGAQARVSIFETAQWLHAVAKSPRCVALQWKVRETHKDLFREITPAEESATVRQLAKELLEECGMKDVVLDFAGKTPTLRKAGRLDREKSISLTHHGRFVAVALARTSSDSWDQEEVISNLALGASSRAA